LENAEDLADAMAFQSSGTETIAVALNVDIDALMPR